ncbi:hypothetical protein ACFOW6_16605 [Fodinicurvata halophila]|uniref:Large polyvalent protein associated domain-containing protein n=1 Tax=Fodinicurvata halophila TaxID=1419723 RepID=A0ABV8UR15_9PROT
MVNSISDYAKWKAKRQKHGVGGVKIVLGSVEDQPDKVASDIKLANEFGQVTGNPIPPKAMVKEYRNVFERKIEEVRIQQTLAASPKLTDWLHSPDNIALSRDDLERLAWMERFGVGAAEEEERSRWTAALERRIRTFPQGYQQWMAFNAAERAQDQDRSFGEILGDRTQVQDDEGNVVAERRLPGPDDLFFAGSRYLTSRLSGLIGGDQQEAAAEYQRTAGEMADRIMEIPMSPAAERGRERLFAPAEPERIRDYRAALEAWNGEGEPPEKPEAASWGEQAWLDTAQFVRAFAEQPGDALAFLTETAVESLPTLAAASAVTLATRNPSLGAAVSGGLSGTVEASIEPAQFFRERGIDISTPEGAMKAISDRALIQEAAERAGLRGTIIGVIDGLSGGIAGQRLAQSPVGDMVLQSIVQAGLGGAGEAGAQLATDQTVDVREVFVEALAEFATTPVEVLGVGGRALVDNRRKARAAENRKQLFEALSGQAQSSNLRNRMPDKFREFVDRATANGPVETVYVPAEQFNEYFQSQGMDPHALADELEGVTRDDLDVALAAGGDLAIPTATYAAKMAGSEHDAFLMENMRFSPDEMTASEAAQFNENVQDIMQEAWEEAERIRQDEEQFRSHEQEIYDTMVSRLRMAGRSTDVATTEAMLYPAFYRVMAERSGLSIDEFMERYPLPQVQGDLPQGAVPRDVDDMTRMLAEARAAKPLNVRRGMTLTEFIDQYGGINDPGGELRARDAETIRRGRGRKTLNLARDANDQDQGNIQGHGPDDVARAAIEAGYLADNPIAQQYRAAVESGEQEPDITGALWDAIDQELRGTPQYAGENVTADEAERSNEWLEQFLEELDRAGVSLDDDDATIRAALQQRYGTDDGQMYNQSGEIDTSSEAFQRWFGDSKIVDRQGRPKVVYHGTPDARDIYTQGFSTAQERLNDLDQEGPYFFTDNISVARTYADDTRAFDYQNAEPETLGVYVKIENPLTVNAGGAAFSGMDPASFLAAIPDGPARDNAERAVNSVIRESGGRLTTDQVGSLARRFGFDGVVVNNVVDDYLGAGRPATVYMVFGATNVKSVNNQGTFDPNDPRILYQSAYHGTPHLFEKFSTDRIGTGEGAQAFGWGLYFAGRREVAEHYRKALTDTGGFSRAVNLAEEIAADPEFFGFGPDDLDAEGIVEAFSADGNNVSARDLPDGSIEVTVDARRATGHPGPPGVFTIENGTVNITQEPSGRLFEVEVPDDSELLLWNAPLSEQPAEVREKLLPLLDRENEDRIADLSTAAAIARGEDLTFEEVYAGIEARLGSDRAASEALRSAGIPGHRFLDGASRSDGDGTYNYVIYDDSRIQVRGYEQNDERGPRGSVQFPGAGMGNGDTVIRLFESADLSTFLHESGHYFLTVMQDLAQRGEGSSVEDLAAVKQWWRENAAAVARDARRAMPEVEVTAEDVMSAIDVGAIDDEAKARAIDVGMQEQWARAFETYLMEGNAPSSALRGAFEKFRAWLISVYQRLRGLDVSVSADLRRVFDRMIATDQEIAEAERQSGATGPVFASAEEMGLTDQEYDRFLKLRADAEEESRRRLLRETMAPIRRQQEKWYRDERAQVREEVEREVNAYRHYRALEWMGNRRWLGDGEVRDMPDMRMSKDILVDRYGAGILKTLPRGQQTVYAVEGGADPDEIAGWFGFDSGDEMIRAMEQAPPRKEAIEAETERVMYERHGDALNDGTIEAEALEAVHTDRRGDWIAAELRAVTDVAGSDAAMTLKQARETARRSIAGMRVRDAIKPNRFLAAERKAGEEAERLGRMLAREKIWMNNARRRIATKTRAALREEGSVDAPASQVDQANRSTANYNQTVRDFIIAKRRQLLNHALYMESRKVAEEVEKAENYVTKLGRKSTREKIAGAGRRENAQIDYLAAIDDILERHDFRRISGRQEERRGALAAFVEAMTAAGRENELAIPEAVLRDTQRKPYKTLSVEELRGVVDSLKNLEHVAQRWNRLIDEQRQRDLDESVDDVVTAFAENMKERPPGRVGSRGEGLRRSARQYLDLVLNASTLLREIDGFKDYGAAYKNIKEPIDHAMDRLYQRRERAAIDLEGLYDVYTSEERRRMSVREYMPELGYSLSKWERIAVALNTGNEGNYHRMTDERVNGHLTEAQVNAVLETLDQRDADFIQSVWDYLETFRDDISRREQRVTGVEPEWVEPSPVTIAGKELRGGYYPLRYDPRLSSLARDDDTALQTQSLQAGRFGKAQTRNGHLKERASSSGRSVELDISVLHRHVNQVIYDLELSEPVANSWRILQDTRIRDAFINAGRQPDFEALEIWLQDVGNGELRAADLVNRSTRMLKSNFTAAKLALNLSTVAIQVTGLAQSAVVVGKQNMLKATMRTVVNPFASGADIASRSSFMRLRQTTFNKDIYDFYNDPRMGPAASRWGDFRREIMGPLSFWLMTKVQFYAVDVPTWYAGYQQGLEMFGQDEAQAIAHADAVVKRAQASGLFSDRSAVERGSVSRTTRQNEVVRLFTALGSYMFAKFNVAYERTARARRVIDEEGMSTRSAQEALSWAIDMAFLFTLEAILYSLIKGRLPDEDDDDDSWGEFLARETAFSVLGSMPFVRDIASVSSGFEGGGAYGAITKEFAAPFTQAGQGEVDPALVKSVINATGLATGLPSTQINRAVDAAWREAEGEDVSLGEYFLGRKR